MTLYKLLNPARGDIIIEKITYTNNLNRIKDDIIYQSTIRILSQIHANGLYRCTVFV